MEMHNGVFHKKLQEGVFGGGAGTGAGASPPFSFISFTGVNKKMQQKELFFKPRRANFKIDFNKKSKDLGCSQAGGKPQGLFCSFQSRGINGG